MSFWDFFWLMLWGFLFVCYLMVLFQVIFDIFRDSELKGWAKALWLIALLIAPPLTALIYLIARGSHMSQRQQDAFMANRAATDDYIRSVASSSSSTTDQIAQAKGLLDSGAITAEEYAALKAKALA